MLIEIANRIGGDREREDLEYPDFSRLDACCAILSDLKSVTEPHPNISVLLRKSRSSTEEF